jgi:hypothetical protein
MPYNNHNYTPAAFQGILDIVIQQWNSEFGTDYDAKTFEGTNAYRFAYVFIQTLLTTEASIAEIYTKLQDYFDYINAIIKTPTTTNVGLVDLFKLEGFEASIRDNTAAQAGKVGIAINVDISKEDYPEKKLKILTLIKDNTIAGIYCDGTQEGQLQLSNGQVKTFRFTPAVKIPTQIQLNVTYARGSNYARETSEEVKEKLLLNLSVLYGLGQDFAPEKYFEINRDAPYAVNIELAYKNSKTSNSFVNTIYYSDFTELFTFDAANITVNFNE